MTVIRELWTFNLDFAHYNLAGVIWMLGWCMILMAGLVRLSTKTIATFGIVAIFLQQLVGLVGNALPQVLRGWVGWIFQFLYLGGAVQIGGNGPPILILYVLVPWIGVMAAGYAFGAIMIRDAAERDKLCLRIGLSATAVFVLVAGLQVLLRPAPDGAPPALFRFLGQQKYPASQLFLLMTLGPIIAFLPMAGRARGWFARAMATFGRVPLFYYLLHIPLIHVAAIVVSRLREGSVNPWLFGNHPLNPGPMPEGYRWSLSLLYLVFTICVVLLYFPCRWYDRRKREHPARWMSYL